MKFKCLPFLKTKYLKTRSMSRPVYAWKTSHQQIMSKYAVSLHLPSVHPADSLHPTSYPHLESLQSFDYLPLSRRTFSIRITPHSISQTCLFASSDLCL